MTPSNALPFPIGSKSAHSSHAALLGQHFLDKTEVPHRQVKLVRAKTAITSPASKALLNTITSGAYNNKVFPANVADSPNCAGIADPALTDNLSLGDFFYCYNRAGDVVGAIGHTTTNWAAGNLVGTITTSAGRVNPVVLGAAATAGTEGEIRQAVRAVGVIVQGTLGAAGNVRKIKLMGAFT